MEVDRGIHREVVHVLHARHDLDVLGARGDRMTGLGERLQRRPAEPVDGRSPRGERQAGHQRHGPADVAAEFAPLLGRPQDHVLDRGRIDPAPLDDSLHDRGGEFVAANMAKQPAFRMRPADRRAEAADDHRRRRGGVIHGLSHGVIP